MLRTGIRVWDSGGVPIKLKGPEGRELSLVVGALIAPVRAGSR